MKVPKYILFASAFFMSSSAFAQKWNEDAPVPTNLAKRSFADPSSVAVYKDKADELVGRWGVLRPDGVVEIMSDRPTSFGTNAIPVVKVTLADTKPIYRSIVSQTSGIKAVVPILDITLGANQKASVTVSDIAQFVVSTMPQISDWGSNAANPGVGKPRLVYIGAALLSVAEISVLKKKTSGISAFFSGFNLGASGDFEEDSSSITHVLSIAIYEPTCRKLDNCVGFDVGKANLAPITDSVKGFAISNKPAAENLK